VDRRENAYEIPRYNVSVVEGVGRVKKGKMMKGKGNREKKGRGRGDEGEKGWDVE
jgi:hypothetical protein